MSAHVSSPELSYDSPSSDFSEPNIAPKRKKRTNFAGLTPQQKAIAKKNNNRQAAQNLRDRKKQQEDLLAAKVANIEASSERLAAQLAQLEQENKAIQDEARMFATQHIERFQLQGLAQRLMGAVQADRGNGQSITALLAAMGAALDGPAAAATAASPVPSAVAAPLSSSPALEDFWSLPEQHDGDDSEAIQFAAAVEEDLLLQQHQQQQHLKQQQEGEQEQDGAMELSSPPPGPVDLSDLPELPADIFLDLLPPSPAAVPDRDAFSALSDMQSLSPALSPAALSAAAPASQPSPVPALPLLTPESVRSVLSLANGPAAAAAAASPSLSISPFTSSLAPLNKNMSVPSSMLSLASSSSSSSSSSSLATPRASKPVHVSNHSAAAGAWPAVPLPLPSGLQQLLMVLICTSLTRLSQAPAASAAPVAAPGPAPSMPSSPLSKRQPGSSACALAAMRSSHAHSPKEYGLHPTCMGPSPTCLRTLCGVS